MISIFVDELFSSYLAALALLHPAKTLLRQLQLVYIPLPILLNLARRVRLDYAIIEEHARKTLCEAAPAATPSGCATQRERYCTWHQLTTSNLAIFGTRLACLLRRHKGRKEIHTAF